MAEIIHHIDAELVELLEQHPTLELVEVEQVAEGRFMARYGQDPEEWNLELVRNMARRAWRIANPDAEYDLAGTDPLDLTETGNADLFLKRHGRTVLFDFSSRRWLCYNGREWQYSEDGEEYRKASSIVKHYRDIARRAKAAANDSQQIAQAKGAGKDQRSAAKKDEEAARELFMHYRETARSNKVSAFLEIARARVPVTPAELDADPWLLNCLNGTIDLRTGTLYAHDPANRITKSTRVFYDPGARAPRFEQFLHEVFSGNEELIRYMQRWFGYVLTGETKEQVFQLWHGSGANGKSTLDNVLRSILGDYARSASSEVFLQRTTASNAQLDELARLQGARVILAAETGDGRRLAEAVVKQMTGGDRIVAAFKFGHTFEYEPQFKAVLSTNHKPDIRGTDDAIWRRIHLIPFDVTFKADRRDHDLGTKLYAERPGILAWAVRGCLEWGAGRLAPPSTVQEATKTYRSEQDTFGAFIEECCVLNELASVGATELREEFNRWSGRSIGQTPFGRMMSERLYEKYTSNGTRYKGLKLRTTRQVDDTRSRFGDD